MEFKDAWRGQLEDRVKRKKEGRKTGRERQKRERDRKR